MTERALAASARGGWAAPVQAINALVDQLSDWEKRSRAAQGEQRKPPVDAGLRQPAAYAVRLAVSIASSNFAGILSAGAAPIDPEATDASITKKISLRMGAMLT